MQVASFDDATPAEDSEVSSQRTSAKTSLAVVETGATSDSNQAAHDVDDFTVLSRQFFKPTDGAALEEDDIDATVVVTRQRWCLETQDGTTYDIHSDDVIIGRKPRVHDATATTLAIGDTSRMISKTHARLRRTGDTWTLEDLGSTNGSGVIQDDDTVLELIPGTPVVVVGEFMLATTQLRLSRVQPVARTST